MYYPFAGNAELFHGNVLVLRKIQSLLGKATQQVVSTVRQLNEVRTAKFKQA